MRLLSHNTLLLVVEIMCLAWSLHEEHPRDPCNLYASEEFMFRNLYSLLIQMDLSSLIEMEKHCSIFKAQSCGHATNMSQRIVHLKFSFTAFISHFLSFDLFSIG